LNNTCERRTKLKPRRVTVADAVPSVTISGVIDSIAGCGDSTGFGSGWPGPTGRLPLKRPPLPLKATGRNALTQSSASTGAFSSDSRLKTGL
jgi:hypothetical protein